LERGVGKERMGRGEEPEPLHSVQKGGRGSDLLPVKTKILT